MGKEGSTIVKHKHLKHIICLYNLTLTKIMLLFLFFIPKNCKISLFIKEEFPPKLLLVNRANMMFNNSYAVLTDFNDKPQSF